MAHWETDSHSCQSKLGRRIIAMSKSGGRRGRGVAIGDAPCLEEYEDLGH
jgi:hypothetical protein